jgi:pimeloyl-ACP methyl ester carboxylesterase
LLVAYHQSKDYHQRTNLSKNWRISTTEAPIFPILRRVLLPVLLAVLALSISSSASAQSGLKTFAGTLPDGATFLIEVPPNWNGTLFLYSHGYTVPGGSNPAEDSGDPLTRLYMLASGFALAGSSYATTGWAIHEALPDQIAVLDSFAQLVGPPHRTIAWGHSLGGMVTAGLIQQHPDRFDAALPMCGVLSGGVSTWNSALDSAFVFKSLLAPGSGLQVVDIANPAANLQLAEQFLVIAQSTPQGRARLALVSALSDTPGWFLPTSPQPAPPDFASQQANQFLWTAFVDLPFIFSFRAELESRAQGNPSFNTGVDYRNQVAASLDSAEVSALYTQAGLDLDTDLNTLNNAPRITADPQALTYLTQNITFDGQIHVPVLTMHTDGDGLVVAQNESAYLQEVAEAGNASLLRQVFVHRAGHCSFTPAETLTAVQALLHRLDSGVWPDVQPLTMNNTAAGAGLLNLFPTALGLTPTPPAFIAFSPGPYLRPFDEQ